MQGGKSKHHNPDTSICEPTYSYQEGEVVLRGSSSCMRSGYNVWHRVCSQPFGFCTFAPQGINAKGSIIEMLSIAHRGWALAWGRVSWCTQASRAGEWTQVAGTADLHGCIPELTAFHSFKAASVWQKHLNWESQHLLFWKSEINLKTLNCPNPHLRHSPFLSTGRADSQLSAVPAVLVCHQRTLGRKDHPLSPPLRCQCRSPPSLIEGVHEQNKIQASEY